MKTENVAESHQTDIPYTFPAGHETRVAGSKAAIEVNILKLCSHATAVVYSLVPRSRGGGLGMRLIEIRLCVEIRPWVDQHILI